MISVTGKLGSSNLSHSTTIQKVENSNAIFIMLTTIIQNNCFIENLEMNASLYEIMAWRQSPVAL